MPEFQACEQTALTQSSCPGEEDLEGVGVHLHVLRVGLGMVCRVCAWAVEGSGTEL